LKLQFAGRRRMLVVLFAALVVLAGCSGGVQQASWFGIAVGETDAYIAANEQVVAVDLESGAQKWAFPVETDGDNGPYLATPLVESATIDIGAYDSNGTLLALSQDGGELWSVLTNAPMVEGPASTQGGLVVGNNSGEVYLIDRETQEKRLLLKVDEAIWATPLVDEANGRVYVPSMDHHLYAVDLESADKIWAFKATGALVGTPALSDGQLFLGTLTNHFFAVDADTGGERWRFDTDGWVWGGPLVDGDVVYFGDLSGTVYALNAADGSQIWTFSAEDGVRGTPLLLGDLLYVGTRGGKVIAIRAADGTQQWSQSLSAAIYTNLVSAGDVVLASPHNAKVQLVALDPQSGAERWSYPRQEE
jgi:outer membrane protein assembly factor BamB